MFRCKVRLAPSGIHGTGAFADEFIPAGSILWVWDEGYDLLKTVEEVNSLPEHARKEFENYSYLCKRMGVWVLCAGNAAFMNHSDNPNTRNHESDQDATVAAVDIYPGDELTCDYTDFDASASVKLGLAEAVS